MEPGSGENTALALPEGAVPVWTSQTFACPLTISENDAEIKRPIHLTVKIGSWGSNFLYSEYGTAEYTFSNKKMSQGRTPNNSG
jgi:hypothetical protein